MKYGEYTFRWDDDGGWQLPGNGSLSWWYVSRLLPDLKRSAARIQAFDRPAKDRVAIHITENTAFPHLFKARRFRQWRTRSFCRCILSALGVAFEHDTWIWVKVTQRMRGRSGGSAERGRPDPLVQDNPA